MAGRNKQKTIKTKEVLMFNKFEYFIICNEVIQKDGGDILRIGFSAPYIRSFNQGQ